MHEAHPQQRYRVIERLAAGGMAEVFLAESAGIEGFKKLVAIKTLLPALDDGDRFVRMLLDEARVASALTHPNIVQLYDLGQDGELPFLVMEYVHGESLASIERFLGRVPDRLGSRSPARCSTRSPTPPSRDWRSCTATSRRRTSS